MKRLAFIAVVLVFACVAFAAGTLPKGWYLAGSNPEDYSVTLDHAQVHSGAFSALLASQLATPRGFGTLMQTVQADSYRGQRIRFTAYVRSEGIENWAGLWFRVDGAGSQPAMLAFDNMHDRPIKGSTEWQAYSVVLDVAREASAIAYGVLLTGPGKVWIDTARIEVVDKNVPTTGGPAPSMPSEPTNLDFEL
ncbi:MAG TPA: hypothetical protein VMU02_04395 [bacterium]|nr:hypothetical protein [bacterium]